MEVKIYFCSVEKTKKTKHFLLPFKVKVRTRVYCTQVLLQHPLSQNTEHDEASTEDNFSGFGQLLSSFLER